MSENSVVPLTNFLEAVWRQQHSYVPIDNRFPQATRVVNFLKASNGVLRNPKLKKVIDRLNYSLYATEAIERGEDRFRVVEDYLKQVEPAVQEILSKARSLKVKESLSRLADSLSIIVPETLALYENYTPVKALLVRLNSIQQYMVVRNSTPESIALIKEFNKQLLQVMSSSMDEDSLFRMIAKSQELMEYFRDLGLLDEGAEEAKEVGNLQAEIVAYSLIGQD